MYILLFCSAESLDTTARSQNEAGLQLGYDWSYMEEERFLWHNIGASNLAFRHDSGNIQGIHPTCSAWVEYRTSEFSGFYLFRNQVHELSLAEQNNIHPEFSKQAFTKTTRLGPEDIGKLTDVESYTIGLVVRYVVMLYDDY